MEKNVWQPEVTILLELKKQLANLHSQKAGGSDSKDVPKAAVQKPAESDGVKKLENDIAQQVSCMFTDKSEEIHSFQFLLG